MKTCKKCGIPQDAECFVKQSRAKDGRKPWCKGCDVKYMREYRVRERILQDSLAVKDSDEPAVEVDLQDKLPQNWLDVFDLDL